MATKRIYDLTNATTLNGADKLPVDRSGGTSRSILATDFANAVRPYASTLEATTGTATDKVMNPANTAAAWDSKWAANTTAFGRSLVDDANAAAARTTLGVMSATETTDALARLLPVFDTRSALKAATATGVAFLSEPGREGLFEWTPGDATTLISADTQEGIWIKATAVAASVGVWVRVFSGPADARWFGASASGTAAANTTALNAAISTLKSAFGGGTVQFPPGTFALNALATIDGVNDLILQGHRASDPGFTGGTIFAWQNASGDCIVLTNAQHSGTRGIYHRHDVRRTGGWTCRLAQGCFHSFFEGRIDYAWNGVEVFGSSECKVDLVARYTYGSHNLFINGSSSFPLYGATARVASDNPYPTNGDGPRRVWSNGLAVSSGDILFSPTAGFLYQVVASGNLGTTEPNTIPGSTGPDGFTATLASGTATLRFVSRSLNHIEVGNWAYSIRFVAGTHILNGFRSLLVSDAANSAPSRPKWIYLEQFESDHAYFNGVELFRGESVYFIGAWVGSSLAARGVFIDAGFTGDVSFDPACRISGNWFDGIYCGAGNKNVRILGSTISDNSQAAVGTYHGVIMDGTTRFQVSGITSIGSRQGYGIFINTGADYYAVIGNNVGGNATGGINNAPGASAGRRELSGNIT
jgi:hypothetical protein